MKRDMKPGPVLMAESELSPPLKNHSCLGRSQKPKMTVSITMKMRTVPTACALSQLKHIGTRSRWINKQVPWVPLESWVNNSPQRKSSWTGLLRGDPRGTRRAEAGTASPFKTRNRSEAWLLLGRSCVFPDVALTSSKPHTNLMVMRCHQEGTWLCFCLF